MISMNVEKQFGLKSMNSESKKIDYLKQQGLKNPFRVRELIKEAITFNNLDLKDLVVFTEAASKNYVVTPIIAAMAGAKVYAITRDSQYGSAEDIERFTYDFAEFCGIKDRIKIVFDKKKEIINQVNIVTNLGFVRPIDQSFVEMMNEKAVIPFMYEAWEYRKGDVDLDACKSKGIPVLATNEDAPGLEVFEFIGLLCVKMLFELEIEVYNSKIVVVSKDKFGTVIEKYLKRNGADVHLIKDLEYKSDLKCLENSDALVIADLTNKIQISGKELIKLSKKISVIQFAGGININELERYNIPYYPKKKVKNFRMGMTLAQLGPKPVIGLHAAGLKIGEIMARLRIRGYTPDNTIKKSLQNKFVQDFTKEQYRDSFLKNEAPTQQAAGYPNSLKVQ